MNGLLDTLGVVLQMAFRNLFANRYKTLIVGGIIGFGALLVVVGTSLLDSVDHAMSRSIIGSVAGHVQVYSSESKDELDVMGGFSMDSKDLAPIEDFGKLSETLLAIPNVSAVVPMGISSAIVTSGNTVDQALARLRKTADQRQRGDRSPTLSAQYEAEKGHVRQIVLVLRGDLENARKITDDRMLGEDDLASVRKATESEFWASFDQDPFDHLEFLEHRLAPLATDADMLFLRYLGTDPQVFAKSFDRMKIVDGEAIPPGQRGFLFSKYTYEEQVKLKAARGLDKIKEARDARRTKIAADADLRRIVRENTTGVTELLLQLDSIKTGHFRDKLQAFLHTEERDVGKLLAEFFKTDDDNFDERYRFFYAELAPELELYRVRIGDTLTIKAFTKSGYVQSANLKVYGTYGFTGLERSPQAGAVNMMDLVSFRELYGFLTPDRAKEIAAIKAGVHAREIHRESAEAELFGARDEPLAGTTIAPAALAAQAAEVAANAAKAAESELLGLRGIRSRGEAKATSYDPQQLGQGVVLNAAVLLKDATKIPETIRAIEEAGKAAGMPLRAVSWQKASGLIGQFATLMRIVLYTAVLIIFVVALVIINNALVMATLERVREIGTLRAIGGQRRFVLAMLVVESVVVGLVFGALGTTVGALLLFFLGRVGIPAANDVFTFFFSGPRLYPFLGGQNLIIAVAIVLVVSLVSSFYPAWLAMRVSPREAMQSEE